MQCLSIDNQLPAVGIRHLRDALSGSACYTWHTLLLNSMYCVKVSYIALPFHMPRRIQRGYTSGASSFQKQGCSMEKTSSVKRYGVCRTTVLPFHRLRSLRRSSFPRPCGCLGRLERSTVRDTASRAPSQLLTFWSKLFYRNPSSFPGDA